MGTPRKRHAGEAGYIAERMNPFVPGTKVVIYEAEAQGVDVGGDRYAVVCDAHSTLIGARSQRDARLVMKRPDNFCEECIALEQATRPSKPASALVATALYLGDNGRAFCGGCAGATARASGCDLSGQPVLRVTAADFRAEGLPVPSCETCGRPPEPGQ